MAEKFNDDLFEEQVYDEDLFEDAPLGVTEEPQPESYLTRPSSPDTPGAGSAFLEHGLSSATLGLTEPIAGAQRAVEDTVLRAVADKPLSWDDIKESYYAGKGEKKAELSKSMEEHPGASVAGELAGTLALPIPASILAKGGKLAKGAAKLLPNLQGYEKIEKARRLERKYSTLKEAEKAHRFARMARKGVAQKSFGEGLKGGAALGFTQGDARLLDGDISGTLEEVGISGGAGAIGTAMFSGVADETVNFIKKSPTLKRFMNSFLQGIRGRELDADAARDHVTRGGKKLLDNIQKTRRKLGKKYDEYLEFAETNNITIDTKEDLKRVWDIANRIEDPTLKSHVKEVIDALRPYVGDQGEKLVQSVEKSLVKKAAKTPAQLYREAADKSEKVILKKALRQKKAPVSTDEGVISAADILPEGRPETKAHVRHDIYEDIDPKTGIRTQRSEVTPRDITPFKPSTIERQVDPKTGRLVVSAEGVSPRVGDVVDTVDPSNLKVKRAQELKEVLNDFSLLRGEKKIPTDVQHEATVAASRIGEKFKAALPSEYSRVNKQYAGLKRAADFFNVGTADTAQAQQRIEDKIFNALTQTEDVKANRFMQNISRALQDYDPKLAKDIVGELDTLREHYLTNKGMGTTMADTGKIAMFTGGIKNIAQNLANLTGRVISLPARGAAPITKAGKETASKLANKSLEIVGYTPNKIQDTIQKIQAGGTKGYQSYIKPLERALKSKDRTRTSIMYGLMQQPAFREMVDALEGKEENENE